MENRKKNKTALIVGLSAAVFAAAAAAVFFLAKNFIKSPEARAGLGLAALASEFSDYRGMLSEKIDFAAINGKTGTLRAKIDVSANIPELNKSSVNVGIDALTNKSEKRAGYSISAGMYGFELDIGEIVSTPDALYITSPGFVRGAYKLGLTNIGREFNDSAWPSIAQRQLPDDLSLEFFKTEEEDNPLPEIIDIFSGSVKSAWENAAFENIKEKKDGLSGVMVTIGKESADECIEKFKNGIRGSRYYETCVNAAGAAAGDNGLKKYIDMIIDDALSAGFKTDLALDFYFDKKGRIVNIETPSDVETEDGALIGVDIKFSGEERVLDIIEAAASINENGTAYSLLYGHELDMEEMSYGMGLAAAAGGSSISFKADGGFEDIVKGESFTFRVNNSSLAFDDKEIFYASVAADIESADKLPEIPDNYTDLLDMNGIEILAMLYGIADSFGKLGL